MQFFVPCDIIWRKIEVQIQKENHNVSQILLRTGLILIMGGIAAAVPELDAFITLVGAVFFSLLGKCSLELIESNAESLIETLLFQ